MSVVTRIAPSPTGEMHIGTVRTALFNYLFAKRSGGTYFVRIEDTDKERNRPEWVEAVWRDFKWCGLEPDVRYVQSEHIERHRTLLRKLVEEGKAYLSKEPAKDDPARFVEVVRLRNAGASVTFDDLIRGSVTFDTADLGDFVIARSMDDPLYHFAVVVDDHDEGVTHVLRAEEHISNTPRQILIQEALGFPRPAYGHFPLILAPDRSKLSKRKHGASIENYRARGFLPEAIVNYLALLGWNPGTERELFSLSELIEVFDIEKVHKAGAIFDIEKLLWFNKQYMLKLPSDEYEQAILSRLYPLLEARNLTWSEKMARRITPLLKERISVWGELESLVKEGELDFFFSEPSLDRSKVPDKKSTPEEALRHLERAMELLEDVPVEIFTPETLKEALWPYATKEGRGSVLWPLRYVLTGKERSPDPFVVASVIGKKTALGRVREGLEALR